MIITAQPNPKVPEMTPGRAVLVGLMRRYLRGLLDPFVTPLNIHEMMYFMQEAGEPLNLRYQKGLYGPYAGNLKPMLNAIEGHLISGYTDGSDSPGNPLELIPGAIENADKCLNEHDETKQRFERVSRLIEGFESPFGLELLASVHWVMKHEQAACAETAVHHVYAWNNHMQHFTPRQIGIAVDVLTQQGWVDTH